MLTEILFDEMPDISSDRKNLLVVCPTEVFLGKEKKNGIYVLVYLHNRDTKFVGVSIGRPVACLPGEGRLRQALHQGRPDCRLEDSFAHFDEIRMLLPFPSTRNTTPFQINHITIDDGAEARS